MLISTQIGQNLTESDLDLATLGQNWPRHDQSCLGFDQICRDVLAVREGGAIIVNLLLGAEQTLEAHANLPSRGRCSARPASFLQRVAPRGAMGRSG